MNFSDGLLDTFWILAGYFIFLPVFILAILRAPWWHVRINSDFHVLLGMTVAILFIWNIKAGFDDGLTLHLLGATLLTLMFGWAFAVISLSVVLAGVTLMGDAGWQVYPLNAVTLIILPVLISHGIYRLVDKKLPNHFFIYIFLNAFFGAAIAIGVVGVVSTLILTMAESYTYSYLTYNYLVYYLLLVFPEAFLTGMLMTSFVLFFPKWVSTFDDKRYLKNH
jgi:uncharacterized membrane protein